MAGVRSGADAEKQGKLEPMREEDGCVEAAAETGDEPVVTTSRRRFLGGLLVGTAAVGLPIGCSGSNEASAVAEAITPRTQTITVTVPGPTTPPAATSTVAPAATRVAETTTTTSVVQVRPPTDGRRESAQQIRIDAAQLATDLDVVDHVSNGDERADFAYAMSFTKGLPHDTETGLVVRSGDFEQFVEALESGSADAIADVPFGPEGSFLTDPDRTAVFGWESPRVGLTYTLIGADPQTFTLPPAPGLGSAELTGEIAEVYAQAVLRDEPFSAMRFDAPTNDKVDRMIDSLNEFVWFDPSATIPALGESERRRRRGSLSRQTAFRGIAPGDTTGPYLSQFLLSGTTRTDGSLEESQGLIGYGAQTIDQRVRQAEPVNYMTSWEEFIDIQNALFPDDFETYTGARRFITTPRDLATYVHSDALYQPYLNACLIMLSEGTDLDFGLPLRQPDTNDHQQGFILYGAEHILTMLVEVCSRALKAVLFQKFQVHRRLRPAALAGRIEKASLIDIAELSTMRDVLAASAIGGEIRNLNREASGTESMLLPMAYIEGSPMHPSYGAGHATVAGACATVLKAFFNPSSPIDVSGSPSTAFVANADGSALEVVPVVDVNGDPSGLTVESEVNKLASNIAIGRDWAGVHYYTDYWESMLLGQSIAIELLREDLLTGLDDYTLTIPTFEGDTIKVERRST